MICVFVRKLKNVVFFFPFTAILIHFNLIDWAIIDSCITTLNSCHESVSRCSHVHGVNTVFVHEVLEKQTMWRNAVPLETLPPHYRASSTAFVDDKTKNREWCVFPRNTFLHVSSSSWVAVRVWILWNCDSALISIQSCLSRLHLSHTPTPQIFISFCFLLVHPRGDCDIICSNKQCSHSTYICREFCFSRFTVTILKTMIKDIYNDYIY